MIKKAFRYFFKKSFFVYGLVGAFVTITQISFLFLLRNYFDVSDFVSLTLAYILALVLHYFLNKHLTFLIKDKNVLNKMSIRYIFVVILSYCIYVFNMYLLHQILGMNFSISLFITLVVNYIVNFFLYENIVFKNEREEPA